jgi:hypothetical protein
MTIATSEDLLTHSYCTVTVTTLEVEVAKSVAAP